MKLRTLVRPVYLARRLSYGFYELRHPDEPWMAQGAVRFCSERLTGEQVGLEWGSGRSTAWFARRLKSLTSVEHDEEWHSRVSRRLSERGIENVDYRYVPLEHDAAEPTTPYYETCPAYVRVAREFADESLDLVIVDGHYRQACVLEALPKLKSGGWMLVDNSNWLTLEEWHIPAGWPVLHRSSNVKSETTIWQKI